MYRDRSGVVRLRYARIDGLGLFPLRIEHAYNKRGPGAPRDTPDVLFSYI
jgi:hypothetical protein